MMVFVVEIHPLHLWSECCGASEGGGERVVLSEWTHGYPLNFTPTICLANLYHHFVAGSSCFFHPRVFC